jgi:signal transduction histidine kinase
MEPLSRKLELNSAIVRNPLTVKPAATIIDAITQMSGVRTFCETTNISDGQINRIHLEARSSCVLVVENGQLLGILTERDIVRLSAQQCLLENLTIREVMIHPVVTLCESAFTDVLSAINLLQQRRIRHLPIINEQNGLVGLLTNESLGQSSCHVEFLRLRLVSEVMTPKVVSAQPESSMLEIAKLMATNRVSSVVIVQASGSPVNSHQIPVGIVTERDLVQFQALGLNLETCLARTVMSTPIFTVKVDDSLWTVWQIIEQRWIRRLAVTGDRGELLGIVTQTSLLQALNPLELYKLAEVLEKKLVLLESENIRLLQNRTVELEQQIADQVRESTQALEQLNAELEQRVEQRTAELQERETKLTESNQQLARATRLKDEFLANMSHELRTPLNAVLGMTEGLQEQVFGPINNQQLKALQTIERSGSHLLELINDILDLAKIESGQVELKYEPTAINLICQASLNFIRQQALKKRIQLEIKLLPNLPDLLVDERRIRQVLINLLSNAVKFTPEGGCITLEVIELPLDLSTDLLPQQFIRIAVSDTGIGIASENISRLFQPFIQIDSALNRQYSGTGLGLSLVKHLVELHGGSVGLTSVLGKGSCFTIDLPCGAAAISLSDTTTIEESGITVAPLTAETFDRAPLILMAEDNESNIATISSYLEAKGYRMILAQDGQEAINLARSDQPDLILMDIQMPGMNGLEAIRQIRLDPALATIPIIALTALAMTDDRARCLAAGANEYLPKPVKLKQLVTTIQGFLATY